jgi:hypothetical protein
MKQSQTSTTMAMTMAMRSLKNLKNPDQERRLIATSMLV